jgi:hypothetical protein
MAMLTPPPVADLAPLRARFRAAGLVEQAVGLSWLYTYPPDGRAALILSAAGRSAQLYLFPEAFPGPAQPFYAALDRAGFGMGSKLGPSISFDPADPERLAFFWHGFAGLLGTPESRV